MSVMIPRYFGMPQEVMRSGLWAQMKPSEWSLCVYLMYESERRSTRQFRAKDSEIARMTGVKSRSLCNARKKLQERGLICYEAGPGNIYVYTICDVGTRLPYPGDPKTRVLYQSKRQEPASVSSQVPVAPSVIRAARPAADPPRESYGLVGVFDSDRAASFTGPGK